MLTTAGKQFSDWTAEYRFFSRERFDPEDLFTPIRREVEVKLEAEVPLVAVMDDTLLRKSGLKMHGAKWRHDPLGPKFQNNLIWSQRFLEVSILLHEEGCTGPARALPIDLVHTPLPKKPSRNASKEAFRDYDAKKSEMKITRRGVERITRLREKMDEDGEAERQLVISVDGGYTNTEVIRALPHKTTLIGRIRKDAKLYNRPCAEEVKTVGRRRIYGVELPTPEQIRRDESIAWQTVRVFAAKRFFDFKIKTMAPVRWRGTGERDVRLVIIHPLSYRLSKNSRTNFREPAYLICTDTELPLDQLVQYFIWRTEIEVNFRDQKTLLGTGQAQVRTPESTELVPAFIAAAYSYLHLAVTNTFKSGSSTPIVRPKWQASSKGQRISTQCAISLIRYALWAKALGVNNFSDFVKTQSADAIPYKLPDSPASAILYAA